MNKLPFALPDITKAETDAVLAVLQRGWVTSGPEMKLFEEELSEYLGGRPVAAVNSATAGLLLVLDYLATSCGWKMGTTKKKVLVPAITFVASLETVVQAGGDPVLIDVREDDRCMSYEDMLKEWSSDVGAVVLVHYAGAVPKDREAIIRHCNAYRVPVIEDAAHSFGASKDGVRVGAFKGTSDSLATVFSFYATKCITTGEGGAVASSFPVLMEWVRQGRLHGITRDAFDRYSKPGAAWEYDVGMVGWKANLGDPAAAMGRVQLSREGEMRRIRCEIAEKYDALLPPEIGRPFYHEGHARHLYPIDLPEKVDRNRFIERMTEQGIGISMHFKPLYRQSAYKHLRRWTPVPYGFKNAEKHWAHNCSLPLYSKMDTTDVLRVVEAVQCSL